MKNIKYLMIAGMVAMVIASCTKDLDRKPLMEVTSASVYADPKNYKGILAKLYAGLAVSGQSGPDGQPDIAGIDEGFSTYLRQYWKAQELTTDEAVIGWNDGSLPDYHDMDWGAGNEFIAAMYNRIFYQIGLCNEFIRETTDDKLAERNISGADASNIRVFRSEARFLRALSYYHALDMYGNVPFVTENDKVGAFFPTQIKRADLYTYVENELKALDAELMAPKTNEYARADKAAAWMLLAKLYLNSEVYIGTKRYAEAAAQASKVIAAGYTLQPNYKDLFVADNHTSPEIIFPVTFDGNRTRTWGGMTFLVHAEVGGSMAPGTYGIDGGWWGLRTTKQFVSLFPDPSGTADKRAMFHTAGQALEINDIFTFTDGYAIRKYSNVTSAGVPGSHVTFVDTDFPMFRLADAYLIYAEAVVRDPAAGSMATAVGYVNQLRQRAYGNATGNVATIDLNLLLDERGRELYWEGHRRTDLIRFGKFTGGTYIWAWKGGVKEGRSVADHLKLFPIPAADKASNPNLTQNPGY
jgi:starch-binding outer membrane protein, SusD/RagB family